MNDAIVEKSLVDQVIALNRQWHEVLIRVGNGSLEYNNVKRSLQMIIGKAPEAEFEAATQQEFIAPEWWPSPEDQIGKVSAFLDEYCSRYEGYGLGDIPELHSFTPRKGTREVPLLAVYLPGDDTEAFKLTCNKWWNFIVLPNEIKKVSDESLGADLRSLSLYPGGKCKPGIRWVAFDPYSFTGETANKARTQSLGEKVAPAHAEVLMAAALAPEWIANCFNGNSPFPMLPGAVPRGSGNAFLSNVARFTRQGSGEELHLTVVPSSTADDRWFQPTIRAL